MNEPVKYIGFALAAFCGAFPPVAFSYETPVHSNMTAAAFVRAIQARDFLTDLGILHFMGADAFGNPVVVSEPLDDYGAQQWTQIGSVREDNNIRSAMHFFDPMAPQDSQGFKGLFEAAPDWAVDASNNPLYSIPGAHDSLFKALTNPDPIVRPKQWADTFRALGQFTHLLQDMAQPQHVRDDNHFSLTENFYYLFPDYSRYEKRTLQLVNSLNYFGNYPIVDLPDYRSYWAGAGRGLAEFTNGNFVSEHTNLDNTKYSSPAGGPLLNPEVIAQVQDVQGNNIPGAANVTIQYVTNMFSDLYAPSQSGTNNRLSTFSIFDFQHMQFVGQHVYSLYNTNHETYADLLVPRAVGYSAGLIEHFFRGRLDITPPQEGVYGVLDHSQNPTGFLKIKLNLKNSTPNEDLSNGTLVAVAKYHLNGCYQSDLSGEFSQDSSGNLITPCPDYRSDGEEIAVSQAKPGFGLASGSNTDLTFDFSASPIPINATDLYLQVVFQGTLGQETGAVVAGTKDIAEPTYLTVFNSTDYFDLNGTFYTPGNIVSDPNLLAQIDLNHDGNPDVAVVPVTLQLNIGFIPLNSNTTVPAPAIMPVASQPIQPGHFIRLAVLVDDGNAYAAAIQSSSNPALFSGTDTRLYTPETNQLDFQSGTYFVAPLEKLRTINVWDSLTYYRTPFLTGGATAAPLENLPAAASPTPDQVNVSF